MRVAEDVLDAVGEIVVVELAPQPIADDGTLAPLAKDGQQRTLKIEALRLRARGIEHQALVNRIRALGARRFCDRGTQQLIGLEPALLRPGRRQPDAAGVAQQLGNRQLGDLDVPARRIERALRRQQARAVRRRTEGHPTARFARGRGEAGPVEVDEVVGMKGRDRIGTGDDVSLRCQGPRGACDGSAARRLALRAKRVRIDARGDQRSEGDERLDVRGRRSGKRRRVAEVGVKRIRLVDEFARRRGRIEGFDADFLGVEGGVVGHLMAGLGFSDQGESAHPGQALAESP